MTEQIIDKLNAEIVSGLRKESQVVYLLAGIRKLIERHHLSSQFQYLEFHCNWTLHTYLSGPFAQFILNQFDPTHVQLLQGAELSPNSQADRITRLEDFRNELSTFLQAHSITNFSLNSNLWSEFIYLYAKIIEDAPLVIRAHNRGNVSEVVVKVKTAKELAGHHQLFKIDWHITDKDGNSGSLFTINSFSILK